MVWLRSGMGKGGRAPVWLWTFLILARAWSGAAEWESLNLPADFRQKLAIRELVDLFLATHYNAEIPTPVRPMRATVRRNREPVGVLRQVHASKAPGSVTFTNGLREKVIPMRGFRAELGDTPGRSWPANLPDSVPMILRQAANLVEERLARDGLVMTFASIVEKLGPAFPRERQEAERLLQTIGFPADWLEMFVMGTAADIGVKPDLLNVAIDHLVRGGDPAQLGGEIASAGFHFVPSRRGFQAALESGEVTIQRLRVQVGGGFERGGIIPGGSIHFVEQLITALPEAKVVASIEHRYFEPFRQNALLAWPLRQPDHLTLISEELPVAAWAQDNGKSGTVPTGDGLIKTAILTPRYASMGEGVSYFVPGESFLMNGLQEAGITVLQSPLLFQGGNILLTSGKAGNRTMLLAQSELIRNAALGLSSNEVVTAFAAEFGADDVLVLPTASYHLDYDVTLRARAEGTLAFVNDPVQAGELVVETGIESLVRHSFLKPELAAEFKTHLRNGERRNLILQLQQRLAGLRNPQGEFPEKVVNAFRISAVDSAEANLRTFCLGLDFLECDLPHPLEESGPERRQYLQALNLFSAIFREQRRLLEERGWEVISVPSMPDLRWGINYLNGVHDSTRYLMPAYGGLYANVDKRAEEVLRQALGPGIKIIPLLCAETQRKFGAVHCMVSVLPL